VCEHLENLYEQNKLLNQCSWVINMTCMDFVFVSYLGT